MKKIGEGYSYKVYEIKNNRVLKIIKTNYLEIFSYLFAKLGFKAFKPFRNILRAKRNTKRYYLPLLKNIPKEILGNPIFINDADYTQDKALMYSNEFFNNLSHEEIKKYLDSYFKLSINLWRYGYHDNVYNFVTNFGLDSNKRMIVIDFNELANDFNSIKKDFKFKKWEQKYDFLCLKSTLKKYFIEKANNVFTIENLEKNWESDLKSR